MTNHSAPLAITMGDPCGIGPEIIVKILTGETHREHCVVIGDARVMQDAIERYGITYPVAIDNDRQTWRAYNQRYWPTTYLIDKNSI